LQRPASIEKPMDLKQIKSLVQLMIENDLSRIELREGDTHILLRRGHPGTGNPAAAPPVVAPAAPVAATLPPAEQPAARYIRSPMVGTFYAAADPESKPFVGVGDEVEPDTVVCLVEAMKVFNEIKAEISGRITKVLVQNAQAVEYDQPLFEVAPA